MCAYVQLLVFVAVVAAGGGGVDRQHFVFFNVGDFAVLGDHIFTKVALLRENALQGAVHGGIEFGGVHLQHHVAGGDPLAAVPVIG